MVGVTTRRMIPSRSSPRSCAVNTFSLTPGKSLCSSANRYDSNDRCHTISTFHLPARTFEVAWTGQPKWFFMGQLQGLTNRRGLQNCAFFTECAARVRLVG